MSSDTIKNGSPVGPAGSNKAANRVSAPPDSLNTSVNEQSDQNKTTSETENKDAQPDDAEKKKEERKRRMKEKADQAATGLIDPMKRMELFDSTKAAALQTKGSSALGSIKPQGDAMMITGRNVGAEQNEPDWSPEQLKFIRTMTETILTVQPVTDTRRSIPDPEMKYVARDETGSIVPTEEAYVSSIDPSMYCIGTGQAKYDITGSPKHYMDAVMADKNGTWLLSQWTSEWVVIEGVANDVLMKQHKNGASLQSNRRIGVHFARIGLPKMAFGPLFATLAHNYPGIMSTIIETPGYYWMNASWGVSSFSATFAYMDNGEFRKTANLADVMRMLRGRSSLCLATVAISITCGSKTEGDKQVMNTDAYALSVKLHNAFGVEVVDYHGPPQQGSTGMMIPSRFIKGAKSMSGASNGTSNVSIFASNKPGLFGTMSQPPASIKSDDNQSYM